MKIAVIGATGRTGRLVLAEGARRGHAITALVRNADALRGVADLAANVVLGDGTDRDVVGSALAGMDGVVVAVSSRGAKVPVTSLVARAVLDAAAGLGVSRLVFTSTYGMVAMRPVVIAGIVRRVFAGPFREQQHADEIVRGSESSWTIVRATRLTDGPATGHPRISTEALLSGPFSLPREDLACALLDVLTDDSTRKATLNVTGGAR